MICPNCGGEYAHWALKCPYCGSTNDQADEKEYLSHLEELRQRLDQVDEESEEVYEKEVSSGARKSILLIFSIFAIILALFLGVRALINYQEEKYEKHEIAQQKWQRTEFVKLDHLYDAGDYDAIIEEYYDVIHNTEYSIYQWPHYEFCLNAYKSYQDVLKASELMAKGQMPEEYILCEALIGAMEIHSVLTDEKLNRLKESNTKQGCYGMNEEEVEKTKSYRQTAEQFLMKDLGWSQKEIDAFEKESKDGDFISYRKCNEKGKEIIKQQ